MDTETSGRLTTTGLDSQSEPAAPEPILAMHASLQFSDPDRQLRSDVIWCLNRQPDWLSLTELSPKRAGMVHQLAEPSGYQLFTFPDSSAIVTRLPVVNAGHTPVVDAQPGPPSAGGHGPRGVSWVKLSTPAGNAVFPHVAHWVTGFGHDPRRRAQHLAMTAALIRNVRKHGRGHRLAFVAGDINLSLPLPARGETGQLFAAGRITTIWDDDPDPAATHGRSTLDFIGSYDPDRRVTLTRWKSHRLGFSDHRPVSAWYTIDPRP